MIEPAEGQAITYREDAVAESLRLLHLGTEGIVANGLQIVPEVRRPLFLDAARTYLELAKMLPRRPTDKGEKDDDASLSAAIYKVVEAAAVRKPGTNGLYASDATKVIMEMIRPRLAP